MITVLTLLQIFLCIPKRTELKVLAADQKTLENYNLSPDEMEQIIKAVKKHPQHQGNIIGGMFRGIGNLVTGFLKGTGNFIIWVVKFLGITAVAAFGVLCIMFFISYENTLKVLSNFLMY